MEAIRKIVKVVDHQLHITLPSGFNAEEVEVIIFPATSEFQIPQWQIDQVRERTDKYLKNPDSAIEMDDYFKQIDSEV
ncbi:MAG: hypothetical protein H0X63_03100 [Flavobacteriales bacterium]|nr:hypothetical protein [Flavobacteriales bacterium]